MYKILYKNRLPHIAPIGATFFVTFRLADSLPVAIIQELEEAFQQTCKEIKESKLPNYKERMRDERKRHFGEFDHQLDALRYGNCYLQQPDVAEIVAKRLHEFDKVHYNLQAYCIMPNHVHVLFDTRLQLLTEDDIYLKAAPPHYVQLDFMMQLIKGGSARFANQVLNRKGTFWMRDSYDHYVRNEREWGNIVAYILNNPVKANLVDDWQKWQFSYCTSELE
jgi:REP element-mobilizing transposase RayT